MFASMIFMMCAVVLALADVEPLYAYMFMPLKFFCYTAKMDKFLSAIAVSLIFLAEVPVVSAIVSMDDAKKSFAEN